MAIENLTEVNDWLEGLKQESAEAALLFQKRMVLLVLGAWIGDDIPSVLVAGLLFQNPVDTGLSRAGWHVSTDGGSTWGPDAAYGGSAGDPPTSAEIASALDAMGDAKPFGVIWIINNIPYIVFLNEGSSPQADPGWIEASVANAFSQEELLS